MRLEQQVCSLELAKKLKELGVPQESLFIWAQKDQYKRDDGAWAPEFEGNLKGGIIWTSVSAFTVAELGEMLAKWQSTQSQSYFRTVWNGGSWDGYFTEISRDAEELVAENCDTEADARAKMLVYLIENNLIAPSRVQTTPLFTYRNEVLPTLGSRQKSVMDELAKCENMTNGELAVALGWQINRVTPRTNELREAGRVVCRNVRCPNPRHLNAMTDVVHDECKRVCGVTRRNVFAWRSTNV